MGLGTESDEVVEVYVEYKLIIKELLFNGASRQVKSKEG